MLIKNYSSYFKEIKQHIDFCREDFYILFQNSCKQKINNTYSKEEKIKKYNTLLTVCLESEYQKNYIQKVERCSALIINLFKKHNLLYRLEQINTFYSELGKIGFSWRLLDFEYIMYVTIPYISDDDTEPSYQCLKLDQSAYVLDIHIKDNAKMESDLPNWFVTGLKTN